MTLLNEMTLLKRTLLFGAYSLCLIALDAGALVALIDLSRRDPAASQLVLVPFVSLALIYLNRDSIFSSLRSGGPAAIGLILIGAGFASAGSLLRASGSANDALSAMVFALVVLWVGGFLLFYGRTAFRAALFPLLFLAFMIPIPSALLDGATRFLKTGSTETVAGLFTVIGTPYHREGFVFSLPSFVIQIGDECSGIRSSIALLLTSLLAGHMFLTTGWKKGLLVLAIFPVAILKNAIRIVTLTLLAMHVDPGFLEGQLHHEGGIIFYFLALVILFPLLIVLRGSDLRPSPGVHSA